MLEKNPPPEPIVQTVWVDCPVDEAFRLFTERFAEWWPLAAYSIHKDADRCDMEPWPGGRLFERTRDGREEDWGEVIAWEPPERLGFTWLPGRTEDRGETVQVEFQVETGGTRVTLIHRNWQRSGEAACALRTLTRSFAQAASQLLAGRY